MSGEPAVTKQAFLRIKNLSQFVLKLRANYFENIGVKSNRIQEEAKDSDNDMIEESLTNLDQRLKEHYSMKGKLEAEVYIKRSGKITGHKKKYEKYARMVRDKMDLQT